jgi:AraC-like DNA-binding protein
VFLGIGRLVRGEPWRMAAHEHVFHEMIVVARGGQTVDIGGRRLAARLGDALFYPRGVPHGEESEPGDVLDTYFFGFHWPSCPPSMPYSVKDTGGRLLILAGWLHEERCRPSPSTQEVRDALLRLILIEFLRLQRGDAGSLVEEIRGFVMERLAEPIDLAMLAGRAGMSRFHFLRTYKALSGFTPMEDVRRMRVERARDLILTTPLPLKEIAPAVGLGDVYHLSRLFRETLSMTPAGLRRRKARGN